MSKVEAYHRLLRAEPTRGPDESEDGFNDRYDAWMRRCDDALDDAVSEAAASTKH